MSEFITVYSAEVVRRLRSRAFIVGLLIGALGIVLMIRMPALMDSFATQSYRVILGGDSQLIAKARPLLAKDFNIAATVPSLTHPSSADLKHNNASAVLVLQRVPHGLHVVVYAKDPGAITAADVRRDLLPLHVEFATNLPANAVTSLLKMPIAVYPVGSKFGSAAQADQARILANILIFLLYLLIVLNSQLILTSVAEEKTSRIAELLVASVKPSSLLAGKIAASATLAILQMILWVAIGFAFGSTAAVGASGHAGSPSAQPTLSLGGISSSDIAGFVIFFLLGYLQMATMFAAIGSLINRTEDIGSIGGPFFVPIIAALLLAVTALQVPDAPAIVAASLIPLISPFVMFARIVVSSPPLWQLALSFAINVAAIWIIATIGGKVYRIGMLLYGRPPKLAQLWHAIRA